MPKITTTLSAGLKTESVCENVTPHILTQYADPTTLHKPGDVLASALGSCMMTMVGAVAAARKQDLSGSRVEVELEFDDKHTRVTGLKLAFSFPVSLSAQDKEFYAKTAQTCPVHNSLRQDLAHTVTIR